MRTSYHWIAGQNVERLATLNDGFSAVAMTLLVLDLRMPATEAVHDPRGLMVALGSVAPRLLMFLMSFLTLGTFGVGQQTQLNHPERSDRSLTWIHSAFPAVVCLVPFSTALLSDFIRLRLVLLIYWINILSSRYQL